MFRPYRPLSDNCIYNSIEKITTHDATNSLIGSISHFFTLLQEVQNSVNVFNSDIADTWGNLLLMCEQVVLKIYISFLLTVYFLSSKF